MATTEWRKHTGAEMPAELAAAQMVYVEAWMGASTPAQRADTVSWKLHDGFHYRPALTEDGRPYVSAEGLEDWAEYVATDACGDVWQFLAVPEFHKSEDVWGWSRNQRNSLLIAPSTHAIPGDPANSLAKVWRE